MSVETTRLDNGLRIVSHPMPHLETASLGVWVNTGARRESPGEHGISHFLEHMAFKGTARRSARDIAEEIESAGGDLNAATSLETTAYYARVLKEDVPLALDILSDILLNPTFEEGELAREREVVVQEIGAANDTPEDIVFDLAQDAAFPGQALGRPVLGTVQTVRGFRASHLRGYLNSHYVAPGMVLAAAGAVDHGRLVDDARERFAPLLSLSGGAPETARYEGGERRNEKPLEQAHLVLGFEGISYRDERFYACQVLSGLLGGGMSSRLFQEVRERRGLCYAIYSFSWSFADSGLFGVYAATGGEALDELSQVVARELARIAEHRPDEAEVARAKAQLKAGLMMSLESSGMRIEQIARQQLAFGRVIPIEELQEKVDAVSAESVRRLAQDLVTGSCPVVSAVGPVGAAASIDRLQTVFC